MIKSAAQLFLIAILFIIPAVSDAQNPSDLICDTYSLSGNKVIFHCRGGAKLSLKFLDSRNIKFWFSPEGDFSRTNESFAVINEEFDPSYSVNVNESASNFEIFTGELRVSVKKNPLRIKIYDKYQRLILGDYEDHGFIVEDSGIETRKVLRDDEQFYGLGEKTGSLNRRGHSYTMWNSDKPCYSDTEDPLYKSIPFFMSSYNYGIFFDNTYKTQFDFGEASQEYFSFSAPEGPFIYYFMYGKDYKEILKSYVRLTGKPIMPPNWALGWSQSRGLLTNEKLTREIATEYRKRNIPCDIIYQDIGWTDGLMDFNWKEENYDHPEKMLADLAEKGFKVIVSQDPVISQRTREQWKEANRKGYFVLDSRTGEAYDMPWPWGGNAGLVDFTNPQVAHWWGALQQKPIDDGVKGFWTDMGEPAWSNEENTDRLYMKHHLGMHDEIHNVYGLTWDKVVTEQFNKRNPNQRVFQMTRAAYAGVQRYAFGWSGDSGNGEDVTDGWDSLENQISVGLSAGMGLIPFWTTDISGYCGVITDYEAFAELYIRWLQFGVFNPLSRAHHEGNNAVEPWLFGKQAEKIARASIQRKYQLHPYIYTYARRAYDTGMPIMRAMVLEYPDDEETYNLDEQFMFGEELLIAPVVVEGSEKKRIYLPDGKWIDYNNPEKIYSGEQYIIYDAPLEVTPILVKEGAIIPKMTVMPYIGAMTNTPMIFEIFSGDQSSQFILYEDEGTTNDYKKGEFSKTKIERKPISSGMKITINIPDSNHFRTDKRNFWLEVHLPESPEKIYVNGDRLKKRGISDLKEDLNTFFEDSGYHYNSELNELYIRIPDTKELKIIRIEK